jgi:hypothetical protein
VSQEFSSTWQQQQQQQQQQPKQPRLGLYSVRIEKMLRRQRELDEEIAEREGKRKMRMRDDGREMREEVQPFGCASTVC